MPDTVTLANQRPAEVRLSPDGNRLYSADSDGFVRIYDMRTGGLIDSWDVGQKLGGMDISPDGSFLVIVERNLSTTYKVDTATGASTSYLYATSAFEGLLFDVAVLSDGTALFSQNFPGSGTVTLKVLDFATGIYTPGQSVNQSSVLSRSATGEYVLIGEPNSSGGPIDIYLTGTGIVARAGAGGYNWGIQAFSGSLAAQYIYNEGIHIYNSSLQRQVTLTAWNFGKVSDLAFSADSAWLYILENESNSIIKVSTADWDVEETIPVAADVGSWAGQVGATNGARLILDPEERYFSVVTDGKLVVVENPDAPALDGTNGPDVLEGALFADRISGFDGDDVLSGFAGNDTLIGGAGADRMDGGAGDDTFFVDDAGDRIVEAVGGGHDYVVSSVSFVLNAGAEVELISTSNNAGTSSINLTGNELANALVGNAGSNVLDGGPGGADTLVGLSGDDTYFVDADDRVFEDAGGGYDYAVARTSFVLGAGSSVELVSTSSNAGTAAINLTGNELANVLVGNAGSNILDGGLGGADTLVGLSGDDTYFVDADDRVFEDAGGGYDYVVARSSFALGAGSSVELISTNNNAGTASINLTGNELANVLVGNAGANVLDGGLGGADTLVGLGGDDTYFVDGDDRVFEDANGGFDYVVARSSFMLEAGASVELMSTNNNAGTASINLSGNELANILVGNAGANVLDGGPGGADTLQGLSGNDTYFVDGNDQVLEDAGGGFDYVVARAGYSLAAGVSVELMSTDNNAGTAAINLTGNELANVLVGNAGANVLDGKLGADTLQGLGGADTFAFTTALGAGNVDAIVDFAGGTDKVALDDAVFTAIGSLGALNANAFFAGTAAHDADDRIVYDQGTGQLFYDADGNGSGAAVLFATLGAGTSLAASDFTVI